MAKEKALLGLSGGVDSSVSALLLRDAGLFEVRAAFMHNWSDFALPGLETSCPQSADAAVARQVAAQLGLPFTTFNFESEYREKVWDAFVAAYKAGETPNPDVLCNQFVKFGALWRAAKEQGADRIATGHYAQSLADEKGNFYLHTPPFRGMENGRPVENPKDQSYFLARVDAALFPRMLFPIGAMEKPAVRALAEKAGLVSAAKADSQGICFVGEVSLSKFLRQLLGEKKGIIRDESGAAVGEHDGYYLFTVGQRQGIALGGTTPDQKPRYVAARDADENEITVVSGREHPALYRTRITARDAYWHHEVPADGTRVWFRLRHRQPLAPGTLRVVDGNSFVLEADEPQFAPAAGQTAAVYSLCADSARMLGCGTMDAMVEKPVI